ncbi:hypothetical protein [Roseivirga seohaensis]|uniref:hypothetical protein n=1 Tax=Roseivirga seohaensis TaxID=1914963 RepID=UPI003BA8464D
MKLIDRDLELIKEALGYGVMFSNSEAETAEFVLLKMKVEKGIHEDEELKKRIKELSSLEGCPFRYCDINPACKGKCRHS